MTITGRVLLSVLLTVSFVATAVPAAQVAGHTEAPPPRKRVVVRPRAGAVVGQQSGAKPPKDEIQQPPRTQRPPRTGGVRPPRHPPTGGGDDVGGSKPPVNDRGDRGHGDDVGGTKPPSHDMGGNDGGDHEPSRPPRDPRRPRPHFPVPDITIQIGGGQKDDKKKDDKKKDDPVADAGPRPLKCTARDFRRLGDSLLSRGRIDAALRVLGLLKEEEYYEYTGAFGEGIAGLPAPPDYTALVARAAYKDKDKSKKDKEKGQKGDKGDKADKGLTDAAGGSWESKVEARAGALLALEQEEATLRAVPEASRSKQDQKRLEAIESDLARAADDLDTLLDGLSRDLGRKDPRVRNLRAAEKLSGALAQLPGAVAIYTLTTEERFWTIVVSPLGRNAYSTPIRSDELDRKVLAFRKVLMNPKQDPAPLARELYDIVLGRASSDPAMLTARTILWSFDGVLRYVPAAALNDGRVYLVERYRNVAFNRASIDTLLDAPGAGLSGVGLGVARQIAPYQPLPAVADELHGIFLEGGTGLVSGKVLLDASFTEPALERALQGGNSVVHIATHFQLSPSNADASLLLLGDGTLVNVGDIRRIKGGFHGVDLLTLSACDTASSGPSSDGREVECFGTIAQERGAKAVIASLWPVNDRSTSLLMQTFYKLRVQNPTATKADLFREAQLAVLTGKVAVPSGADRILVHEEPQPVAGQPAYTPDPNAPFAHPYYWAPFVLIGNYR